MADVESLTDWRNRHVRSFLTEFDATVPRTRNWLTTMVDRDDSRLLFMLEDRDSGLVIGYLGLAFIDWHAGRAEADSVVRGAEGHAGAMSCALSGLLRWARSELGLISFGVRVLADNPALSFYVKQGFRESRRASLARVVRQGEIAWQEIDGPGDRELVYMEYFES